MRKVDRTAIDPPSYLTGPDSRGHEELERARSHISDAALSKKAFPFKVYKNDGVKAALHALFHGKCAYCESYYNAQAPVDVEHFRPKAAVEGEADHPGYWWLAMAWDNLLPSCIDCNRRRRQDIPSAKVSLSDLHEAEMATRSTGKGPAFPIAGTRAVTEADSIEREAPYLLDPCRDDPAEHLEFYINHQRPIGLVLPKTRSGGTRAVPDTDADIGTIVGAAQARKNAVRGAVSIQLYGLNRLGLVQERTRILRHLEFLRHLVAEIDKTSQQLARSRTAKVRAAAVKLDNLIELIVAEIAAMAEPDQPYSAMVRQWIDAFKQELAT